MHGVRSFEKRHRSSQPLVTFHSIPVGDTKPKTLMETATVSSAFPASLHAFIDNEHRLQNTQVHFQI